MIRVKRVTAVRNAKAEETYMIDVNTVIEDAWLTRREAEALHRRLGEALKAPPTPDAGKEGAEADVCPGISDCEGPKP